MMKALHSFQTSKINYPLSQCNIPEEWNAQPYQCQNLKAHWSQNNEQKQITSTNWLST